MAISESFGAVLYKGATFVIDVDRVNNTVQMGDKYKDLHTPSMEQLHKEILHSDLYNANLDSLHNPAYVTRTQDTRMVVTSNVATNISDIMGVLLGALPSCRVGQVQNCCDCARAVETTAVNSIFTDLGTYKT